MKQFDTVLGFYIPSFFKLEVKSNIRDFNFKSWPANTQSVFFHEYIHFLQDITTIFGLNNIYAIGDYILYTGNEILKKPQGSFQTPIPFTGVFYQSSYLSRLSWGTMPKDTNSLIASAKPVHTTIFDRVLNRNIDYYEIQNLNGEKFRLGAVHIMESMAYLGQQIAFGAGQYSSPNTPYNIVEQIAKTFSPEIANDKVFLFGACDYALAYSIPAKALINAFDYTTIHIAKFRSNPQDILNDLIQAPMSFNNDVVSFNDAIDEIASAATKALDGRYKGFENYNIRTWYRTVIKRAVAQKKKEPFLLTKIVMGGMPSQNDYFRQIFESIGTPLVANSEHEIIHKCPKKISVRKRELLSLWAYQDYFEIVNLGLTKYLGCTLKEYCQEMCLIHTNEKCKEPWTKARKFFPCPFGRLWYNNGLKRYRPK